MSHCIVTQLVNQLQTSPGPKVVTQQFCIKERYSSLTTYTGMPLEIIRVLLGMELENRRMKLPQLLYSVSFKIDELQELLPVCFLNKGKFTLL